jgi:trimeric autotransporter adhesin
MEMTWARRPGRRRARAALLGATVVVAILLGLAPGASAAPTLVSQTPDATAGVDGRVQAIVRFGDWLYVGGSFSAVSGKPRAGLARVNIVSGAVDPSWSADVVGSVIALATSPDGATLYVGGEFTSVAGAGRENLAALSAATGAVVATWNPGANRSVQALAASSDRLYVGGKFTRIGGAARAKLAGLSAATGAVDPAFTPNPDQWVAALRLADGRLFAAGFFTTVGGAGQPYLAELSPVTGTATGWRPSLTCPVYALDVVVGTTPADRTVYVACGGSGGSALAFSTSSNLRRWLVRTNGNLHAVAYLDGAVYLGGHSTTMSGADRKKGGAVDAATGALTSWNPSFNSTFGIWAMLATDGRLWAGGDFTKVGTTRQLRLARFSPPT